MIIFNNMNIKDYINIFTEDFFKQDYETYKPKIEEYKDYLKKELSVNSKNVKAACQLASAYLETREDTCKAIDIMENILQKYEYDISEREKCELYTNISFFYTEESSTPKKGKMYLEKALLLESPYAQTYNSLGIYLLEEYYSQEKPNYAEALTLFKKSSDISSESQYLYNYAVALYENGKNEKAAGIFENIIKRKDKLYYLSLYAYALIIGLNGNIKKCLEIADELANNIDKSDSCNPQISENNIADLYYICEEYKKHNDIYDNAKMNYFHNADFLSTYFYALYVLKENDKLKSLYDEVIGKKLNLISEEEKYEKDTEEEKERYIAGIKENIDSIKDVYNKIINENYKPKPSNILSLTYGCNLVDCIRHGMY